MRIVIVAPAFWPATLFGGPVHSMTALVRALAARGEQVTVLTSNRAGSGELAVPIEVPVSLGGAQIVYLDQRRNPPYGCPSHLERWLESEAVTADILHVSSTLTRISWQACRWAMRRHVPYVVTTRGHLIRGKWWKNLKKRVALRLFLDMHLRAAARLHATSSLEAEELKRLGFENVEVVSHGVELPEDLPDRQKARERWAISDGDVAIIFLGRLHPQKGLDLLIKAVGQLARLGFKTQLLVAGHGDEKYLQKLQDLTQQEGIAGQCRFVGHVTGWDKWAFLRAGDVLVHLSTFESFGLSIGEALGVGLPVLIGDQCGWDGVAELGIGIRVQRSLDAVVAGLIDLLSDRDRFCAVGAKASAWIRTQYGWDRVADEMVSLYTRGVESGRAGIDNETVRGLS